MTESAVVSRGVDSSVSVIIPTYNRRKYVREAVKSAADQGAVVQQIIVVDDGSTDGTYEDLTTWAEAPPSLEVYWHPNAGRSVARNRGAHLAISDYVLWLDSDDILMPGGVGRLVDAARPSNAVFSYGDPLWLVEDQLIRPTPTLPLKRQLLITSANIAMGSFILRRDAFARIGPFVSNLEPVEDLDFTLRAFVMVNHPAYAPKPVVAIRRHEGQSSAHAETFARAGIRLTDFWLAGRLDNYGALASRRVRRRLRGELEFNRGVCFSLLGNARSAAAAYSRAAAIDPSITIRGRFASHLAVSVARTFGILPVPVREQ